MTEPTVRHAAPDPPPLSRLLWVLAAATLVFFLATARGYGYFRDELYYLACGEHLGWGYVDHPPLIGWIAAVVRGTFGTSLLAIRALPALAAAATVWLAGAIARQLGGGSWAQATAAVAALVAPVYLSLFSIFSMNAFDLVVWAGLWWLAARLLACPSHRASAARPDLTASSASSDSFAPRRTSSTPVSPASRDEAGEKGRPGADPRLWVAFGALAGVGLMNKISVLFLGFGVVVGLVAVRRWELLRGRWPWLGGGLALLLFLPHVVWQAVHGWPTLEFMENARRFKMLALSPAGFLVEQAMQAGPAALPLWLAGLGALLAGRRWRAFRPLGWAYLAILVVMIATGGKAYYLAPAYTLLFAAGAVAVAEVSRRWGGRALRAAVLAAVALGGVVGAPLGKPLLPVESYVAYAERLGVAPSSGERHRLGRLPQFYADMHGWPELAAAVAEVHRTLPPEDRARACVFGENYGQAGAVDLFGPALGLGPAVSGHNSYYLWGPGDCTGEVLIVIGGDQEDLRAQFASVEQAATHTCRDCMPYESDKPLWVVRGLKAPLADAWPAVKHFN